MYSFIHTFSAERMVRIQPFNTTSLPITSVPFASNSLIRILPRPHFPAGNPVRAEAMAPDNAGRCSRVPTQRATLGNDCYKLYVLGLLKLECTYVCMCMYMYGAVPLKRAISLPGRWQRGRRLPGWLSRPPGRCGQPGGRPETGFIYCLEKILNLLLKQ